MKLFLFPFFIILTLVSCHQYKAINERMDTKFRTNEAAINYLVSILNNRNSITDFGDELVCKKADEFNSNISQKLHSLGLRKVCLHYGNCKLSQKIFIFETDWISQDSVCIVNNICDTVGTKKGYYKRDENSNEVWGLGDSWQIIKVVKYLNQKQ